MTKYNVSMNVEVATDDGEYFYDDKYVEIVSARDIDQVIDEVDLEVDTGGYRARLNYVMAEVYFVEDDGTETMIYTEDFSEGLGLEEGVASTIRQHMKSQGMKRKAKSSAATAPATKRKKAKKKPSRKATNQPVGNAV